MISSLFYNLGRCFLSFLTVQVCFNCFSCVDNFGVSSLNFMPPVLQSYGVLNANNDSLQFFKVPSYEPFPDGGNGGSPSLKNIQQSIMQRLGNLGSYGTMMDGSGGAVESGYGSRSGVSVVGGDNSRLLLGLREMESFPRQKQRFGLPLQALKCKNSNFLYDNPAWTVSKVEETPCGIQTAPNPGVKKGLLDRDVINNNDITRNENENMYNANRETTGVQISMADENERKVDHLHEISSSTDDKIAHMNRMIESATHGHGIERNRHDNEGSKQENSNEANFVRNHATTLSNVQENNIETIEPYQTNYSKSKQRSQVVKPTLDSGGPGMINRDFIKSNNISMESIKQPKERKLEKSIKVNSQDCKICRAIKEKNMKRNKTRPKCEHCMGCKVKKNNDIGKPEKEYSNNGMTKKVLNRNYYCSSSNDNEVGEKKCLPKQRPTTCHPEECIRKIKELLQSIEPSTSSKGYQMCREQNDMRKRKRDHDECEKSHQVNTKRKNPENNRRSHEDDKDTQTRGSCKKPHNPDKSGNRKCSDTEILTKPSKSKGKGKSKTAKKKKKDTSKGKWQKDLKIKSKVDEEETSKKCNHDKNRKESREKKDRRSNCDTNEDIEHCESDDNDQDTNSDDDDLEETEQNDEQDMDNGTEDEELNEYENNEEELLNNEDEEDDDDADLETPETENTSDVDEASDCENSDKTLSIVKRILNKLGFKNRSFVDLDTVKRSSPDLTILALLIIILIILAVIFVTVRIFNRKHDIAIDSQGEFQVVKMDIGQKYETCLCCNPQSHANHNVQQLYFCREKMNDPNTGSFSTVLKALYLPDQNSYQKLSQTSLYSSLTPELNDEEKCARKILHGKRHIKSSIDLHKSKK